MLDHVWTVGVDDASAKRRPNTRIHFDVVLAPGAIRSSHPQHEHDLITAKLLAYHEQSSVRAGYGKAPAATAHIIRSYFTFVRWRNSRGIPQNSDLTKEWLEEFFATIRTRGPMGLLPLQERATELLRRYVDSGRGFPIRDDGKGQEPVLAMAKVANDLGLDHALSLTPGVRQIFRNAAAEANILAVPEGHYSLSAGTERPGKLRTVASAKREEWSVARVAYLIKPLELLHRFRDKLSHDPIPFDPFAQSRSVAHVARSLATAEPQRTPTIPAAQACYLIDRALAWVLDYSIDIQRFVIELQAMAGEQVASKDAKYRLLRRLSSRFDPAAPDGPDSPWPTSHALPAGATQQARPSLHTILFELLPTACMIVIAAFSARRFEEIDSLRADCVSADGDDYWMDSWISKTLRRIEKIPVPATVGRAVQLLEWLSESRRQRTGEPWIFGFDDPLWGSGRAFSARSALARFADFVDVPPLADGTRWWFAPHQFRRFFGIVYYHHYRFPHLAALSNFYRHFDPDMTRTYVSEVANGSFMRLAEAAQTAAQREAASKDRERLTDFQEEAHNFRVERYRSIATGQERSSGFGGEVLAKELEKLVAQARSIVEITPDADEDLTLDELLDAFAQGRRLEPNPLGHSYCKCTSDSRDLDAAACLTKREATTDHARFMSMPDPAFASDRTCSSCPHNVQFHENEQYWRELGANEERQAACALGPLMQALHEERSRFAEQHLARCFE